ncbi:MAG: hybrid sensor histidine kinase/response regulator [Phenylobacterium zucineum]|nr:MAG: hybrid sensor histidine kinase/response regulator [Phenylobacterium zucineum]
MWTRGLATAFSGSGAAPEWPVTGVISALIVFVATLPFAGWRLPVLWLPPMLVLAIGEQAWSARITARGPLALWGRLNPFAWLSSVGYSAAAFYLTLFHGSAGQTLGVTLYGVVIFQTLARDYTAPRRLMVNMIPPLTSLLLVQLAAGFSFIDRGTPWQIVTLLASPFIVYRAFHTMRSHLVRTYTLEQQARTKLSESETRYRLLAERSPDLIMRYDLQGVIAYASPAAANYGYDSREVVGRNLRDFLDPSDWPRQDFRMKEMAEGRAPETSEQTTWRSRRADGSPITFEGAFSPLLDDLGRATGAIVILRDVTAREAIEENLRRQQADAEAAAVAKSQFLANMSHEIRTPLTGVIGFAGLLEAMPRLPKDARRYASRIHTSAAALLTVVNDVLDFSKLEANQVELDPQPMELRSFLDETVDLVRELASRKGLRVAVEAPGADLPARIVADGARLRQVLLNLLTNAVKFTETGEVTVMADRTNAGDLRIAVRDTGIGVAPEVAGRLFLRFSQVDGSNARQHGGTGLGLAISKGLIEMMRGQIGMESRPGAGSTFWFTLPVVAAPDADPAPVTVAADVAVEATRLLMVDDVAVNRELVTAMLAPFDVTIVEASNGAAAVQAALAQPFDLILMDLQMPGMDGLAATAAIRATSDLNRTTPIVALSANVLGDHVDACLAAGMNDHIGKPINPTELLTKIARWTAPATA